MSLTAECVSLGVLTPPQRTCTKPSVLWEAARTMDMNERSNADILDADYHWTEGWFGDEPEGDPLGEAVATKRIEGVREATLDGRATTCADSPRQSVGGALGATIPPSEVDAWWTKQWGPLAKHVPDQEQLHHPATAALEVQLHHHTTSESGAPAEQGGLPAPLVAGGLGQPARISLNSQHLQNSQGVSPPSPATGARHTALGRPTPQQVATAVERARAARTSPLNAGCWTPYPSLDASHSLVSWWCVTLCIPRRRPRRRHSLHAACQL